MILLELVAEAGLSYKKASSAEYYSPCPHCPNSEDSLRLWPFKEVKKCKGKYWCRRCNRSGDSIDFAEKFLGLSIKAAFERVGVKSEFNVLPSLPKKVKDTHDSLCKPPALWIEKACEFIDKSHELLLKNKEWLEKLHKRGIPLAAVIEYGLGWNTANEFPLKEDWGIQVEVDETGQPQGSLKMFLPRGLVIPTRELNGDTVRIKIRRADWVEGDKYPKYVAVSRSMNGNNIFGDTSKENMFVVESELDAIATAFAAGDRAFAIAVGGNNKNIDIVTDDFAKKRNLFVCPDNDRGGETMQQKWQPLYPHARICKTPNGKDIGMSVENGLNLREWLLEQVLSSAYAAKVEHRFEPSPIDPLDELAIALGVFNTPSHEVSAAVIIPALPIETPKEPEPLPVVEVQPKVADTYIKAEGWLDFDRRYVEWWLNLDRSRLPDEPSRRYYSQIDAEIAEGTSGLAGSNGKLLCKLIELKKRIDQQ